MSCVCKRIKQKKCTSLLFGVHKFTLLNSLISGSRGTVITKTHICGVRNPQRPFDYTVVVFHSSATCIHRPLVLMCTLSNQCRLYKLLCRQHDQPTLRKPKLKTNSFITTVKLIERRIDIYFYVERSSEICTLQDVGT